MNILLTGGTGFLGSALARHWTYAGHRVTVLSRSTSLPRRLGPLLPHLRVVTLTDNPDIMQIIRQAAPDAVVHTACAYGRGGVSEKELFEANVGFGMRLLFAVSAWRGAPLTFLNTGTVLDSSVSTYAHYKNMFSERGKLAVRRSANGLRFLNVRLQHMYGADDDPEKFTTQVLRTCYYNGKVLDLTRGEQKRDLIYIDDVVSAYDLLLLRAEQLGIVEDIDLGFGEAPTIRTFVERVHALTNSRTELKFGTVPYRPNEAMCCQADIARLRALGWTPSFDLTRGIQRTIELEFHS